MKNSILLSSITIVVLAVAFWGYNGYQQKKELKANIHSEMETKVNDYYRYIRELAKGTNYNVDSLSRLVFDTIPPNQDAARLDKLIIAKEEIEKLKPK